MIIKCSSCKKEIEVPEDVVSPEIVKCEECVQEAIKNYEDE